MSRLNAMLRELLALVVDDVPFTLAIVAWVAAAVLVLPVLPWPGPYDAVLLFAGCAATLVLSVRRSALAVRVR